MSIPSRFFDWRESLPAILSRGRSCGFFDLAAQGAALGRLVACFRSGKIQRSLISGSNHLLKQEIEQLLASAVTSLLGSVLPEPPPAGALTIERTRDPQHGDFATNAAMRLAKPAGCKPRELAQKIIAALPPSPLVARTEIAGTGFINFFLTPAAYGRELAAVHVHGERYGRSEGSDSIGRGERVLLEFVSANPTGPLHVGHGRQAAYGATLGQHPCCRRIQCVS